MIRQRVNKDRKGERGSVLALSAISMLTLLLATGLAVDVSHFYTAKAELQNAADAAALAAASQLNSTSGGVKCAVTEATKALNRYDFSVNVAITSADITFSNNLNGTYVDSASAQASPTGIRFVKVSIPPKPVGVTFAALALGPTQTIPAKATAGMSVGLTMNKFYTAFTFIESASAPITKGTALTLNAKAYNDSAPTSYRVLAGPDGDLVLTGPIHAYGYIGSAYNIAQLSAAEMCRYAKIGTNTRFGDYSPTNVHPSVNPVDEPPDTITQENITYQQYTDMQGNGVVQNAAGMKNRRIMTVPIADNSTYNIAGRTVTSNRLAAFFIKKKMATVPNTGSCNLDVEYIGAPLAVPEGTFSPGSSAMSELTIPVLYK
ncbi:MAG TPA: pilus assembly protein TadG-related protein [Pyrinomonadaceae bacterium]|nr:pilus assembly protein TadG-related protein [Pyrinomonadaceae bacterium]